MAPLWYVLEHQLALVLIAMIAQEAVTEDNVYCKMDCRLPPDHRIEKHTMCKYQLPENCRRMAFKLSRDNKRWVLEQLNSVRNKVATGNELRGDGGGQPAAGDMMKLVWDGELAMMARRWADQCDGGLHDTCRTAADTSEVGQNSYEGWFEEARVADRYDRLTGAIASWLGEVVRMKPAWLEEYAAEAESVSGNYSQLVWGATSHVGCGYSEFETGEGTSLHKFRFVCNFKRAGNVPGKRAYRKGRACSSCPPRDSCSVTFTGLCYSGEENYFADQEEDDASLTGRVSKFLLLSAVTYLHLT